MPRCLREPSPRRQKSEPRVRRGYFESRYGQLHVHNAIPPGGGFEEATALLCLHGAADGPYLPALPPMLGRDRRSMHRTFRAAANPTSAHPHSVREAAAALGDFLDSMRFRQIDVLGYQSGSLVAAELAVARPQQVRRVVLVGVPVHDRTRSALRQIAQPVLVCAPQGRSLGFDERAREFLPRARVLDLPQLGAGLFESAPDAVAAPLKEFLGA